MSSAVDRTLRVHIGPDDSIPGADVLRAAIVEAGAVTTPLADADALVWLGDVPSFPRDLPDSVRWVQLKYAGIEEFFDAGLLDSRRRWTNASGFYADNVAEHALGMLLAGLHQFRPAIERGWDKDSIDPATRQLHGSTVAIVGAGGIARSLIPRLSACGVTSIAVNRSGASVDGAAETFTHDRLLDALDRCDHVVVAAPSTPQTYQMINDSALQRLSPHSWIVNVARGTLIDHDALLNALQRNVIGGAALDVTDPEPLPADHPLWSVPNVIITPHTANPASTLVATMAPWVGENVRRFRSGEPLLAELSTDRNY